MLDTSETLGEKFIRKGFWLYFFSFISAPIGYILKIVFSYNLSIDELGVLYGVISLVGLLTVYHDLGMTESLNYFLPKYIIKKDWTRVKSLMTYALIAQIFSSVVIGLGLYFGAGWMATHYFQAEIAKPVLQIFCYFFLGMNVFMMTNTFFGAIQNTKSQKGTEFLRMMGSLIMTLIFWRFGQGNLINYAWTWVFGLIFGISYSLFIFIKNYYRPYLRPVKAVFEKPLFTQVMKYAFWVLLATNIGSLLGQIDMQLIVYFLGPKEAGYYTNYLSMIGMPYLFVTPIIAFLFPVISELHGRGDLEKITLLKNLFYKYFSIISIAVSIFLFVFAHELTTVLFGTKFAYSGEIMMFSAFFLIFNILLQINFQILGGIGQAQGRVKILGIGLFINLVLNLILIHTPLGSRGSSLAVGLSWIPLWVMSLYVTRQFPLRFDWKFFFKNTLWMSIFGVSLFFGKNIIKMSEMGKFGLLFVLLIIGVVYVGIFTLINFREGKIFFTQIKEMRKKQKIESAQEQALEDSVAG